MARHARRLILWTCGSILALVLLALLVIVIVVLTVDPDRFRGRVEAAASAAIGRSVALDGGLHWSLGWRTAIASRGGTIANATGFGAEPFAKWQELRLGIALRPLLHRELRIDRVEMDGLQLRLQRNAKGEANWVFTPAVTATESADAGSGEGGMKLQVGAVALHDAAVQFQDAAAGRDWQFTNIQFETRLPPDLFAQQLSIEDLSLHGVAGGAPFAPPGVPFRLQVDALQVDRQAEALVVPAWTLQWAEAKLEGSVQARNLPALAAQGSLKLRVPSLRELLASVSFPAPVTRDPNALRPLHMATRFQWQGGAARLDEMEIGLDDTTLSGSVELPRLSPLALRFQLAADQIDVDRYLEPEDAAGEPFELPLAALKELDARGVLTIREARMAGAAAKELRIDVE